MRRAPRVAAAPHAHPARFSTLGAAGGWRRWRRGWAHGGEDKGDPVRRCRGPRAPRCRGGAGWQHRRRRRRRRHDAAAAAAAPRGPARTDGHPVPGVDGARACSGAMRGDPPTGSASPTHPRASRARLPSPPQPPSRPSPPMPPPPPCACTPPPLARPLRARRSLRAASRPLSRPPRPPPRPAVRSPSPRVAPPLGRDGQQGRRLWARCSAPPPPDRPPAHPPAPACAHDEPRGWGPGNVLGQSSTR